MSPTTHSAPGPSTDPALVALLRADLQASGFTVEGVEDALGPVAAAALHREQALPALRASAPQVPAATHASGASPSGPAAPAALVVPARSAVLTLTRLFVLGREVPARDLDAALPGLGSAGAQELGLVALDDPTDLTAAGPVVRPLVDLRPYSAHDARGPVDWWLASDLGELATSTRLSGDHVLGAGGASITLAQVTGRSPRARVLDLGTGCGIQALHASRHAQTVVATDISERALRFAAFNAALDGAELDLRLGSMLDPVAGEEFDLVVSNPPFVITPRTVPAGSVEPGRDAADRPAGPGEIPTYEYRDGGRSGDDLVRDLVTGVGAVLAPGGVAQMLGNWEHRAGEAWTERVGRWLDESGLDGWVVQREVLDPAEYAETWIRDGGTTPEREPEAWASAYGAWLDDFASRDVEAIGFGFFVLRKPLPGEEVTLRRLEEHTGSVRQPLGTHLEASLAAHLWLETLDDEALAQQRLVVAADVTEERFYTPGAADPNIVIVRQGDGLGRGVHASTSLSALVGACDGELSVGQIVAAIATIFEVSGAELAAELLPAVRNLVRDGFLVRDAG
ncbi:methyltransferase [Sanguibacter sp. 4.1]|uniref:Methyltransferase n=1 Tax=Sanguibacter biliveldensis TaxID=3030830 RepID=A0AAF0Z4J9_9MICO|nr:methyltransferase [Sanguibacter sp. 4.1]WPF81894.1 methyltransferase [Sanguibacter sp. 4.1]